MKRNVERNLCLLVNCVLCKRMLNKNCFVSNCCLCTWTVDSQELVPAGSKSEVDGWHVIQYSGGKNAPTKFNLNLYWLDNTTHSLQGAYKSGGSPLLLKVRTDLDRVTPAVKRVLEKLPPWCSLFGKSTSPYTLSFLTTLPVDF